MKPIKHAIYGLILSLIMWYFMPVMGFWGFLIVFSSSILIDIDHYLYYLVTAKKISLKRAYEFYTTEHELLKRSKLYDAPLNIFHTIEIVIILIYLSWNNKVFFLIWLGFFAHYALDFIQTILIDKAPHQRQYSIIWYLIKKYR